jgi:ribosomal subunit interface protein
MKFVKMEISQALNNHVHEKCSTLRRRFDNRREKYKITMKLEPNAKNPESRVTSFKVTGVVQVSGKPPIRVSKIEKDAKKGVNMVVETLEKKIRRLTEKQERSRKTFGKTLKPVRALKWELNSQPD